MTKIEKWSPIFNKIGIDSNMFETLSDYCECILSEKIDSNIPVIVLSCFKKLNLNPNQLIFIDKISIERANKLNKIFESNEYQPQILNIKLEIENIELYPTLDIDKIIIDIASNEIEKIINKFDKLIFSTNLIFITSDSQLVIKYYN